MILENLIQTWGLPALFAGGVFEGDTVAMLGGALAHRGHLGFWAAAGTVGAGAALADQLWFHLARAHRERAFIRRIAARPAAMRVMALVARRPVLAIVGFRFVWGMRTIGPVALGVSEVPGGLYVALNLMSVAVWAVLMTGLGYGAGRAVEQLFGRLPLAHHLGLAGLAILALVAAFALLRRLRPA